MLRLPKPVRGAIDAARRKAERAALRACYAAVNVRDGCKCRVCGAAGPTCKESTLAPLHHHHLVKRSLAPERIADTSNVVLLCGGCHDKAHGLRPMLQLSGDADIRDHSGRLFGVNVLIVDGRNWKAGGWR